MARKQKSLPGMERKTIKELDDAGEAYKEVRDERIACTEKEVTAKQGLIAVMKKHKVQVYKDMEATPPLVFTLQPGKDNVKVTEADEGEDDVSDDQADEDRATAKAELKRRQKARKGKAAAADDGPEPEAAA